MKTVNPADPVGYLVNEIASLQKSQLRRLIGVAGSPASGKSTLAAALVDALVSSGTEAALVPMDGFHLDNSVLSNRGLQNRKGSPESFDADGFVNAIRRLQHEDQVVLPVFDRARDLSIAGAISVNNSQRVVVVEGNYLCFSEHPWSELAELWDLSVFLDVSPAIIEERLVQRWLGLGLSREEALAKVRTNDLPNADRINRSRAAVDILMRGTS